MKKMKKVLAVLLTLAMVLGMRVTEIISLNIEDVNIEESYVVCKNRTSKRIIPLGNLSLKALNEYITNARDIMIRDVNEKALFVNVNGKRLTRQGFWKIIKYYKEQAHITKEITPFSNASLSSDSSSDLETLPTPF